MKITSAELFAAAAHPQQFPRETLPEIVLAGRSNVGKSSLINTLLNRKNLARTSSQPGRTQLIFFYKVNNAFFLVDLPGYGYAKVSKELWAQVRKRAEGYFKARAENIASTLIILDARVGVSPLDKEMLEYLSHHRMPYILILNKADKISQSELNQVKRDAAKWLLPEKEEGVITFSAKTGWGKDRLWGEIQQAIASR